MRASIVAPVLALVACDKVLGLDQLGPNPDAIDAPPGPVVTGKLSQTYTNNDSSHTTWSQSFVVQ
ncbi:MAG TPA: hypothetical protein VMJ10_02885 [Kofleriaceae bacterium]|nr:hypothetical protein [Kofleriaceae bacterium]